MTLFNSSNPRIAAAHAAVVETLGNIPDEYGSVFVVDDLQAELMATIRDHTRQQAIAETARLLNKPGRKGRRKSAPVIDFATRERIAS